MQINTTTSTSKSGNVTVITTVTIIVDDTNVAIVNEFDELEKEFTKLEQESKLIINTSEDTLGFTPSELAFLNPTEGDET